MCVKRVTPQVHRAGNCDTDTEKVATHTEISDQYMQGTNTP